MNNNKMNLKATIFLLTGILLTGTLTAQQPYSVTKAAFSTDAYDEFAPAFYRNGIVFCSNKGQKVSDNQGKGVIKMYYTDTIANNRSVRLFSKALRTKLNDGPATFNRNGDTIYYSRNQDVEGNYRKLSNPGNRLGLFYAVYEGKTWTKIRDMRFNSEWFNITMPCLAPDGERLYFVSDKPDGYGGSDIYYAQWRSGYWEDPVNLGPQVNTKGNESYPFINESGELFFSSDGHPGIGGKDIYVTKQFGDDWRPPIRLAEPLNSESDDFGIITDALMNEGYFSSNRGKTIDIYKFSTVVHQVWFSEPQKENQYCFTISDTGSIEVDTMKLQYVWDFGDNSKTPGINVRHCFPGPGKYSISLDFKDRMTGKLFFHKLNYDVEIIDNEQPFITSADNTVVGESTEFSGLNSFCPGYDITGYFWDFGDKSLAQGERVSHTFKDSGEYDVMLGLTLRSKTTGNVVKKAVTKKVIVLRNSQERVDYVAGRPVEKRNITDIRQFANVTVNQKYSAETDFSGESLFQVEILSSGTRTALNSSFFRNLPSAYSVKEVFDAGTSTYKYIVDEQMTLMACYQAYREMIAAGYNDSRVNIFVVTDPAAMQLLILKKNYGVLTDTYFDANNKLITNAYLMLDQVVTLMNRYPDIKLEIGVYTDNQGTPAKLLALSQTRAQVIVNYLINRGINGNRLVAKGYGSVRPLASNTTWLERRFNRRIDLKIISE